MVLTMAARDPLKEYLQSRAQAANGSVPTSSWPETQRRALAWLVVHWERVHTAWIVALATLVSFPVYAPYDDWKKFAALPVLVLFMTPVVALAEIPVTFVLVAVMEWIKARAIKRDKQGG